MRTGRSTVAIAVVTAVLIVPATTFGANPNFPGSDPSESPRANTPDDPNFDACEEDDPDTGTTDCSSYFSEQWGKFGFSPDSAYFPAPGVRPMYADCVAPLPGSPQLDQQGKEANTDAGDPQCSQIGGVRADTAWKYSTGSPKVVDAILDTGIRWQDPELVDQVHLNKGELPVPNGPCSAPAGDPYDCNDDGVFNVEDYADDPRVSNGAGDTESDAILDGSDLIARFSKGAFHGDDDGNGYEDDIAGWDFFDDDNDPFDASSCCSANGHGTGRAKDALAETNNANAGVGLCPKCQVMPLRIWDTFVTDPNTYAMGIVYAADNGATIAEGAVGGLGNPGFARRAFKYADGKGMTLTMVSSDINSANHNYPTNYNEGIYIAGSLPDSAPNETCSGPGGQVPEPPEDFAEGCEAFLDFLEPLVDCPPAFPTCVGVTGQPPTSSFFRNSNLTQYGGKNDVVLVGTTGSENTGQASGAAGLIQSYARKRFGATNMLSGNEVRQLMTMSAEDVQPENTGVIGEADRANDGWDSHFGYGRLNLAGAMARIKNDPPGDPDDFTGWPCNASDSNCVPPEAQLESPDWFAPINVDRVPAGGIPIKGYAAAPHSNSGVGDWEVEYACGQDAEDSDFQPISGASGNGPVNGVLGTLPKSLLQDLADNCDGSVLNDPGRPAGAASDQWPEDPYPSPDPERHAFQIRLTVHEQDDDSNVGRYRKTLSAYNDDGNLAGWPKPIGSGSKANDLVTGSGGEVSPRLYDIDGDNELDVVLGTTSGELYVLKSDGTPLQSWNGGQPTKTQPYAVAQAHGTPGGAGEPPREGLRNPVIGDIDGDLEPEVVADAGEHVYAWHSDGSVVDGFPVRIDPSFSEPCNPGVPKPCFDAEDRQIAFENPPAPNNHIKRGFLGSSALADLDCDGKLDIVAGSLDQHLYGWNGEGDPLDGFPVKLSHPDAEGGAEIVTSPAIAELDGETCEGGGDGGPEVVQATNELVNATPSPGRPFDLLNLFTGQVGGFDPVYAVHGDGSLLGGQWPVLIGTLAPDLLPLVGPGNDAAALDIDGDGTDEVSVSAFTGKAELVEGDGQNHVDYSAVSPGNRFDQSDVLNTAEYPAVGDILGAGEPSVFKGGITLNGAANLLAVNQNLPFNHVVQAWDPNTGQSVPGFPQATDDFQFFSQPAIAKLDAGGPTRQALVGTGLYQLHAYGPGGSEPAGWPKFMGGWIQPTPAVGDTDGDGKLDVSAVTREGWSFLWETDAPSCEAGSTTTNEEWWTFHHDEFGSANYGTDARPPGTPEDLAAQSAAGGSVNLSWKAPGDDWLCGKASKYRILGSQNPIDHPGQGQILSEQDATEGPGETAEKELSAAETDGLDYVAVLYRDDASNWGHLASATLPAGSGGGGGGGANPPPGPRCSNKIKGTAKRDRITGTDGGDRIKGRRGRDRIHGEGGDDCINGGKGRDRLFGDAGDDTLRGGKGFDRVRGGDGDDLIKVGGKGRDKVKCGPGDDTAIANRRDRTRGCETVRRH
jgi:Subtilase family/RTX calcium-binding nonapeptide repeat (4 copies)